MVDAKPIHIIAFGGTIDSYFNGVADTAVPLDHSAIPSYLHDIVKSSQPIAFTELAMKDSRNLGPSDYEDLLDTIAQSESDRLMVTMGTYGMTDTARMIKRRKPKPEGTVVVTGGMYPLTGFTPSDAPFNLGFALANARLLDSGVYIIMNGAVNDPDDIGKDLHDGRFYLVTEGIKPVPEILQVPKTDRQ